VDPVFLSLGTNLGDRLAHLHAALDALPPDVQVRRRSPVYETPAWGYEDQGPFLNMVIEGQTALDPVALLARLKQLETDLGRRPSFRWGPRVIDMDILFYGEMVLDAPELTIPHPRLQERAFVLVPLADIAPDWKHPVLNKTVRQMLAEVDASGIRKYGER
jgi:2-amino-4-hydroxy-6-hydroxymethyldihydropteridine diphosphokinase